MSIPRGTIVRLTKAMGVKVGRTVYREGKVTSRTSGDDYMIGVRVKDKIVPCHRYLCEIEAIRFGGQWLESIEKRIIDNMATTPPGVVHYNAQQAQQKAAANAARDPSTPVCPQCGSEIIMRERRPNGNATCAEKHVFPLARIITWGEFSAPQRTPESVEDKLRRMESDQQADANFHWQIKNNPAATPSLTASVIDRTNGTFLSGTTAINVPLPWGDFVNAVLACIEERMTRRGAQIIRLRAAIVEMVGSLTE